jgi:hypothetical protein
MVPMCTLRDLDKELGTRVEPKRSPAHVPMADRPDAMNVLVEAIRGVKAAVFIADGNSGPMILPR